VSGNNSRCRPCQPVRTYRLPGFQRHLRLRQTLRCLLLLQQAHPFLYPAHRNSALRSSENRYLAYLRLACRQRAFRWALRLGLNWALRLGLNWESRLGLNWESRSGLPWVLRWVRTEGSHSGSILALHLESPWALR
jgi:hypothetical protein